MGPDSDIYFIFLLFYIIGSLPFALIVHNLLSTNDPRELGSKNPGATNMYRVAGPLAGVLTFTGDFLKGFIPIYMLVDFEPTILYLAAFFILAGHMFSIFNRFSGGKGVATSFGFLLAINLKLGLIVMLMWVLVFALKRISGLSAIISFILLPFIALFIINNGEFLMLSILHTGVILINHRNNIKELLQT
jgi:glycerol-3-phosphate acyltransferase PlsY